MLDNFHPELTNIIKGHFQRDPRCEVKARAYRQTIIKSPKLGDVEVRTSGVPICCGAMFCELVGEPSVELASLIIDNLTSLTDYMILVVSPILPPGVQKITENFGVVGGPKEDNATNGKRFRSSGDNVWTQLDYNIRQVDPESRLISSCPSLAFAEANLVDGGYFVTLKGLLFLYYITHIQPKEWPMYQGVMDDYGPTNVVAAISTSNTTQRDYGLALDRAGFKIVYQSYNYNHTSRILYLHALVRQPKALIACDEKPAEVPAHLEHIKA